MTDFRIIIKIARAELKNLFYSPVAWFLSVAFLVQCAVFYCMVLVTTARWQDVMKKSMPKMHDFGTSLTTEFFMGGVGVFRSAMQNLYLFIPLLTMGLISREVNNGSIRLLYSSPVRTREIVLGKYLAMMIYNFLLVLLIGVFVVSVYFQVQHADLGALLSGMLGFYLMVCAYAAIGMFMSSLSNYQIVSAISSFIIIFILGRIGSLWQQYEFVRDLTFFLSLGNRTIYMLKGLIISKDVIYFLLIAMMFIAFTIIKLKSGRQSRPWYVNAGRYCAVVVFVLMTGYVTSRPVLLCYLDATKNNYNTLHPNIQRVVKEMDQGPMDVTLYVNLLAPNAPKGFPKNRNTYLTDVWERYLRFKPDINFHYVYYYDTQDGDSTYYRNMPGKNLKQIAEQITKGFDEPFSMYKSPAEIRKIIDLKPVNYFMTMELQYNGRRTFLRTYSDNGCWPTDENIAASLKRLLPGKRPQVVFLAGNLERDLYKKGEREYKVATTDPDDRSSLVNLGFDVDTLGAEQPVPRGIATLVLADPKTTLSPVTLAHIRDYVSLGGNLMVLGEPGKQAIVNPVLQQLGVRLEDGTLIESTTYEAPNMVRPYLTPVAAGMAEDGITRAVLKVNAEGDTARILVMQGATAVTSTDSTSFSSRIMISTMPERDWLKKGPLVADSAAPVFNAGEGDSRQHAYATVMILARKLANREQRVVVCGDADFLSNMRQKGQMVFESRAMFCWLNYGGYPIFAPEKLPEDTMLRISEPTAKVVQLLFVWILPAGIVLLGIVILVRRKRQ